MKNKIRKKMHKCMMNLIRRINKSFEEDNWFNGKYHLQLCDEFYNVQQELICWYIYFIDDRNPLHTYLYRTDSHYYWPVEDFIEYCKSEQATDKKYRPVMLDFEYGHLHEALNSWLQFCEHGEVFDSPPKCNMTWGIDDERKYKFINSQPTLKMPSYVKDYIEESLQTFNSNLSFVYTPGCKKDLSNIQVKDWEGESVCYKISGLAWAYDGAAIIADETNHYKLMIVKVIDTYYAVVFEDDPRYKPGFKSTEFTNAAYKINLDEFDKDKSFQCYLYLNGLK